MSLVLGHFFFLVILICSQSWGVVSNRNSNASPRQIPCASLQKLYESNFSIERNPQCQHGFQVFKLYLTNAYNACRVRQGLPELSCNENSNSLTAAQQSAVEISAAIPMQSDTVKKYFGEFSDWVTEAHLAACVRTTNGELFTKSVFTDYLRAATREVETALSADDSDSNLTTRKRKRASDEPFQFLGKGTKQIISTAAGAILWRARGGAVTTGSTHAARLLFATMGYGALGWFNGGTDGLVAGGLSSVPLWLYGWSAWQDQGRNKLSNTGKLNEGGSRMNDFLMMSLRGLFQTSLSGGYLLARGYDGYALASGGAMGLCYAGSYELDDRTHLTQIRGSDGKPTARNKWIDGPTSLGELCTGAAMGAGLSTTLQNGRYEN